MSTLTTPMSSLGFFGNTLIYWHFKKYVDSIEFTSSCLRQMDVKVHVVVPGYPDPLTCMQACSVKYGGSNLWSLDESMCRISQVLYEISSALYKRGKSVLADFRYVSSEALSEDIWSLISSNTAVDDLSIEVSALMKIALGLPWTHFVFNFK